MKNNALLTLDRLRLAVNRNETAKKRAGSEPIDSVEAASRAAFRRDVLGIR